MIISSLSSSSASISPDKINEEFAHQGWKATKPLDPFDPDFLIEDLAQFTKEEICVDFGFYGDGVFRIYVLNGPDWENPWGLFTSKDWNIALGVLLALPRITESLGPDEGSRSSPSGPT